MRHPLNLTLGTACTSVVPLAAVSVVSFTALVAAWDANRHVAAGRRALREEGRPP